MNRWDREVPAPLRHEEVKECVSDPIWQVFRVSMKGKSTTQKLVMLDSWCNSCIEIHGSLTRKCDVQVGNYINALKRGGLLNDNLEVVR